MRLTRGKMHASKKRKKKRAVVNSEGHAQPKDKEEPCSLPPPPQEGPASPKPDSDLAPLSGECQTRADAENTRASTQQSPADHSGSGHADVEARYEEEEEEEESPVRRYFREQGIPLLEGEQISQLTNYYQESIGCGSYGWCCRTRVPGTGQEVVVKTFRQDALEDLFTEASVLQSLQVAGVQRLVGVCVETCQMVTCFAGQIAKDFLLSPVTQFKDAVSVCLQVARTLRKIHLRGVAHNDIKGNNVCFKVSDQGPIATIIDFGLARTIGTRSVYPPAPACRYPWAAPELLQEDALPFFEESDVYSLAYLIVHGGVALLQPALPCPARPLPAAAGRPGARTQRAPHPPRSHPCPGGAAPPRPRPRSSASEEADGAHASNSMGRPLAARDVHGGRRGRHREDGSSEEQ
ncbi:hypothetical protein O3P69_016123 [Scylla paramamosain]|uniref:Protein kinase domain-containing protein n=1 Tax=Scylla paramamosain TaxID=85552 RepID=A0AAW0SFB6_SCYPA